jgi:peptidyl-prolyl cis-trans isomerase B (cyclophilin B)
MFKKQNQIWLYLIGIIVLFGVLIAATSNVLIPILRNPGSLDLFSNFNTPPSLDIDRNLDYYADITTNFGVITIDLFEKDALQNVNNFISLANRGYYNGTKFHRLFPDFMIQGGDRNTLNNDPGDDGKGRPGYLINDEINWDSLDLSSDRRTALTERGYQNTAGIETQRFERYMVGLANGGPNTNGSQFFIILSNPNDERVREFDGYYTPLGRIVAGFDSLDRISQIEVDATDLNIPRPVEDIVIQQVRVYTR